MKFFKNTLLIVTLFTTNVACAKQTASRAGKAPSLQPAAIKQAATKPPTNRPVVQPKVYTHILATIKTTEPTADDYSLLMDIKVEVDRQMNALQSGTHKPATQPQQRPAQTKQQPKIPSQPRTTKPIIQNRPIEQNIAEMVPTGELLATNNVIIILDPSQEETVEKRVGALTQCALQALYEKAAPIIMTSNIFAIITTMRQRIGSHELQQLRTSNPNQMIARATQLFQSHNIPASGLLAILLSFINFDTANLNCYFHISANLVLLIPKQYITTNLTNAANLSLNDQAQACGFNSTIMTAITDLSIDNLLQQLRMQQATSINEEKFVADLTSMFIPQKRNGQLISPAYDTKWAIYLTGHGGPAHQSIGTVREQLKINKSNFANMQGGRSVKNKGQSIMRQPVSTIESTIKKYEKMLEGKANWPNSQLIPESARVAGLKMDNFAQLMKFFDDSINTAFIHYSTCFAGGYNQSFVNEILSSLNVNFIVSSEGVHEGYVVRQLGLEISNRGVRLKNQSFTDFFRLLRLFISQPEEFVRTKEAKKEPVGRILHAIVPSMEEGNQPFVRFPGAGVFGALSLGKKSTVLTQAIVKAHEIENKPIDVSNKDIDVVIVKPSRIDVPLRIGKNAHCAIVSPTPETVTPGYEAIHLFKEINFENSIQLLLYNFIHLNARFHTQTFVVSTLTGILLKESKLPVKPSTSNIIHNLIIQMKGIPGAIPAATNQPSVQSTLLTAQNIKYGTIGVNVQVSFELNGEIYQSMMGIKNFDDPNLERIIQQITFISQSAQTTDMNLVANKFLTPQEVTKLRRPITLDSIVQCIDSKIDQQNPSMAEQPGTDNKALLEFTKRKKI